LQVKKQVKIYLALLHVKYRSFTEGR